MGDSATLRKEDSQSIDKSKIFNDPIHGFIEVHPLLVKIINTRQFQRLKNIKQLGLCDFVYPGATHTRFEHALGTSYLCGKLIDTLYELHREERKRENIEKIEITKEERLCVKIAGLCRGLGHGPFSYFFEKVYMKKFSRGSTDDEWKHATASLKLFDDMLKSNRELMDSFAKENLDDDHVNFIKDLIQGKDPNEEEEKVERICPFTGQPKWFLYEIVSNKRNGIDCNKFDYIARDCANVGVRSSFDHRRYFENVRIMSFKGQLQICVRDKEVFNLYELFHTRWSLHHRVYKHKTKAPIEDLLARAFSEVDEVMKISEAVTDMKRYTILTDSILYDILRNESGLQAVENAQELIRCIQERKIYKFCGQTDLPSSFTCPKEDEIVQKLIDLSERKLTKNDIFVSIVEFDFGMKDKNPVDAVRFFDKSRTETFPIKREKVSKMLPQNFQEIYVRVYAKKPKQNEDQIQLINEIFGNWCDNNKFPKPYVPKTL